jgi:hypothetical protein
MSITRQIRRNKQKQMIEEFKKETNVSTRQLKKNIGRMFNPKGGLIKMSLNNLFNAMIKIAMHKSMEEAQVKKAEVSIATVENKIEDAVLV